MKHTETRNKQRDRDELSCLRDLSNSTEREGFEPADLEGFKIRFWKPGASSSLASGTKQAGCCVSRKGLKIPRFRGLFQWSTSLIMMGSAAYNRQIELRTRWSEYGAEKRT